MNNQFADEEIPSGFTYPPEYKGPRPIEEQIYFLAQTLNLDPTSAFHYAKHLPPLESFVPRDALEWTGWFAIPRWQMMAATYSEAVEEVLAMIASKRKFYNYRYGQLGAEYLRQHAKTMKMFQKLGDKQEDFDILVVPAQFGMLHRGRSVRRAREIFQEGEFGLGAFDVGIMLLTHPEREVQWEQLHIDCAGDEFVPGADGDFSGAPLFGFGGGEVRFHACWFVSVSERFGSATAFLPTEATA